MTDDEILSVAQVAREFGVTPQTIRAWIAAGKLKGGRIGKSFHIRRSDVAAMLDQAGEAPKQQVGSRVSMTGALAGDYVVERVLDGGRLILRPDARGA
jgi:excisionase family DNA binding protein